MDDIGAGWIYSADCRYYCKNRNHVHVDNHKKLDFRCEDQKL